MSCVYFDAEFQARDWQEEERFETETGGGRKGWSGNWIFRNECGSVCRRGKRSETPRRHKFESGLDWAGRIPLWDWGGKSRYSVSFSVRCWGRTKICHIKYYLVRARWEKRAGPVFSDGIRCGVTNRQTFFSNLYTENARNEWLPRAPVPKFSFAALRKSAIFNWQKKIFGPETPSKKNCRDIGGKSVIYKIYLAPPICLTVGFTQNISDVNRTFL